jgi:hypothetical protein
VQLKKFSALNVGGCVDKLQEKTLSPLTNLLNTAG